MVYEIMLKTRKNYLVLFFTGDKKVTGLSLVPKMPRRELFRNVEKQDFFTGNNPTFQSCKKNFGEIYLKKFTK